MENNIQNEAWIVRMDDYSIWLVKCTQRHAIDESSQVLQWFIGMLAIVYFDIILIDKWRAYGVS